MADKSETMYALTSILVIPFAFSGMALMIEEIGDFMFIFGVIFVKTAKRKH